MDLAIVEGEVHLQENEVAEGKWIPLQEAKMILSFENLRTLSLEIISYLIGE